MRGVWGKSKMGLISNIVDYSLHSPISLTLMWWSNTRWVVEVSNWWANSCLDQRQFPWPDKQLFLISKISGPDFFLDCCLGEVWLCESRVSCVALFRRLFSHAVEIKSEKLGIHANSEYQPFYVLHWLALISYEWQSATKCPPSLFR